METPSNDGGPGTGPVGPAGPGPGGSGNDPVRPTSPPPPKPNIAAEPHPAQTPRFDYQYLPLTGSGRRYDTTAPGIWRRRWTH